MSGDIEAVKDRLKKRKADLDLSLQPHLIIVGKDIDTIDTISVEVDNTSYCPPTLLKGLDIRFKVFATFNLSYPPESEDIWYFIQWSIFDVKTTFDIKIPHVYTTINKLKNHRKKQLKSLSIPPRKRAPK